MFERDVLPLYCPYNGRPDKPIRLMVAMLILKHVCDLSDESVVEQRSENIYYQYFCGEQEFRSRVPCEASEMEHFRHRIGPEGIELIFNESIRVNGKDSDDKGVYIDTTVQEKSITYPTDDKLAKKVIRARPEVRTIAGRLVREVGKKLGARVDVYQNELALIFRKP